MSDLEDKLGIKLPFHLIYNPVAGVNSTAVAEYVRNALSSDVIEMNQTKGPKDVTRIVSEKMEFINTNPSLKGGFIIIGGDGTANEAVNASGDLTNAIFIFAGGGTGRDIARTLNTIDYVRTCNLLNKVLTGKASLEDYVKATDLIKVQYDEGKQVRAVNLFSIGIDGLICKEVNTSRTKGGFGKKNVFITKTLKILREKAYKPISIAYILNNEPSSGNIIDNILTFTLINGRYAAAGMNYNPEYCIDDGMLEGLILKNVPFKKVFTLLKNVALKKNNKHITAKPGTNGFNKFSIKYLKEITSVEMSILVPDITKEYYFEVDGEHHKLENPHSVLRVETIPRATSVLYISEPVPLPQEHLRMFYDKKLALPDFEV